MSAGMKLAGVADDLRRNRADADERATAAAILDGLITEGVRTPEEWQDWLNDADLMEQDYIKLKDAQRNRESVVKEGRRTTCPACGRRVFPGNRYCSSCGKALDWTARRRT